MFSIDDIIDLAVQIEQNGEKILRAAQKKAPNPEMSNLFKWLADEEVQHANCFLSLKPTPQTKTDIDDIEEMGRNLLRDILGEESFSLTDADFSEIRRVKDLLLKMMEFEKDTVLFYEMIRSVVSGAKTIGTIDRIIAQEKQHEDALRARFDSYGASKIR